MPEEGLERTSTYYTISHLMKKNPAMRIVLSLLSAGWLLPLGLATEFYASYHTEELLPALRGEPPLSSFPHLTAASQLIQFGLTWLGVVIATRTYCSFVNKKSPPNMK